MTTIGLVLVAFALRAHRLAAQCLWSDEDITLDRAGRPLHDLLAGLPVEQAPLYYVFMRAWSVFAGTGDFALRFPSLLFGVLCVPLAAYVGARLAGLRGGTILALVVATNPFVVYYGQEARMYTLLMAAGLLALACILRAETTVRRATSPTPRAAPLTRDGRPVSRRWWIAAGIMSAMAVYTHYYGMLIVLVLLSWALLDWRWSGRGAMAGWLLAGVVLATLFAPWLPRAAGILDYGGWREARPPADALWTNVAAWTAGVTADAGTTRWIAGLYAVLGVFGLGALGAQARRKGDGSPGMRENPDRRGSKRAWRVLALLAIPLAAYAVVIWRTEDYDPRYFFVALPAVYLVVAAGAAGLPRPLAWMTAGLLGLSAVPPLINLYANPAFQKQDYRGFLRAVESAAGHEDTVLFLDGPTYGLARRYEIEDSPVKIVDLRSSGNRRRTDAELAERVAELAGEYPHLWLAESGGARGVARRWLSDWAYMVVEGGFQDITLTRHFHPLPDVAATATYGQFDRPPGSPVTFGGAFPPTATAGAVLPVALHWVVDEPITRPLKVSLRLIANAAARPRSTVDPPPRVTVDRPPSLAVDRPPQNGVRPTTAWRVGERISDRQGILLPRDFPPGRYEVEVVLYDAETLWPFGRWSLGGMVVEAPR